MSGLNAAGLATAAPRGVSLPIDARNNPAGKWGFLLLVALCTMNVNFITRAMFGTEQVFSLLYMFTCGLVLFSFGFRIQTAIGPQGRFWFFAIFLFLLIATRAGFGIDRTYFFSPSSNLYRIIAGLMITACCAMGARHMVLQGKTQQLLRIVFSMLVFASLSILLTKYVPGIYVYVRHAAQDRHGGFFQDPNRAGQAVCFTAAFGFATLVGERNALKPVVLAGIAVLLPCVLVTYSRSSIVFLTLLVLMQTVISPIVRRKGTLIGMLVVAIGIPIAVNVTLSQRKDHTDAMSAANTEKQQERMQSLLNILKGEFDDDDLGHRGRVGSAGMSYFFRYPIVGAGYRVLTSMPEAGGLGSHNTFIRVFGESGILGGICFVLAIIGIALAGWRCHIPEIRCLVVGYVAMYSCGCMVAHTLLTSRINNALMGVALGCLTGAMTLKRMARKSQVVAQAQAPVAVPNYQPSPVPTPVHR